MVFRLIVIPAILLFASANALAQNKQITLEEIGQIKMTDSTIFQIELKNLNQVTGKIIKSTPDAFWVKIKNGKTVQVNKADIKSIWVGTENDFYPSYDSEKMVGANHYFVMGSAYNLKKGETNLQATEFISFSGRYGVSDHLSVGGGMILPFVWHFSAKVSYQIVRNVNVSTSVIGGASFGIGGVLLNTSLTLGKRDANITVGYSKFLGASNVSLLNISGIGRAGRKFALLFDNLINIYEETDGNGLNKTSIGFLGFFGGRFIGNRGSLDLGIITLPLNAFNEDADQGVEYAPLIPFISYTFRL